MSGNGRRYARFGFSLIADLEAFTLEECHIADQESETRVV